MKDSNKSDLFNYSWVFLLVLLVSGATFLTDSKWFVIGITMYLLLNYIVIRRAINNNLLIALVVWIFINVIAMFILESKIVLPRIIFYSLSLIILPFLVISRMGITFWQKFEKIVFILTVISIPIFLLSVVFQGFFDSLGILFHPLTRARLFEGPSGNQYWSALIYVNSIGGTYFRRNCGFMWEPGAFAMMIILGVSIDWLFNGIKFNRKFIFYAVAMITSQSTAGYLAFFILMSIRFMKKLNVYHLILLSILIFSFVRYVYKFDFIGGEISYYINDFNRDALGYDEKGLALKGNRFTIAAYDIKETLKYPFGYGVISKKDYSSEMDITGVNGLTSLLKMWGIPLFVYFIVLIYRFFNILDNENKNKFVMVVIFISSSMMFFSNPIARNHIIYLIFFTALLCKYKTKNR